MTRIQTSVDKMVIGGGEMGASVRAFDWVNTSLGSLLNWSPSLRTSVNILLNSPQPMVIAWGQELSTFYNDAYCPFLLDKEQYLGQPLPEVLPRLWSSIGCQLREVMVTGEAVVLENIPLSNHSNDFEEEVLMTVACTPLWDENTQASGVLLSFSEQTRKMSSQTLFCKDKSEQVQDCRFVEEALRDRELLYYAIGEAIDYGIWVCDSQGRNIYASESFLRLTGLTQEECSEFGWGRVLHPDEAEQTIASWQECVRTSSNWDVEHRVRGIDGEWHHILARGVPVRNDRGELIYWAGINLDISRLKQVELALREQEERLAAALRASQTGTYRWQLSTNTVDWDDNLKRLFGLPEDFAVNRPEDFLELIHPDDRQRVVAQAQHCLSSGTEFEMEFRVIWSDGSVHWLLDKGKTIFDKLGQSQYVTGACVDITQLKQAEAALSQSQERLTLAMEAAQLGLWDWNKANDKISWSYNHARLFGLKPEEFDGTYEAFLACVYPDDHQLVQQAVTRALQVDGKYIAEFRVIWPDGSLHWITGKGQVFYDATGEPIRMLGIVRESTAAKQAEQEREQLLQREQAARAQAEAANRIKDEFLTVLSHELRSPLNPILGWTSLLRSRKFDQKGTERALEIIERNAQLQTQLIEDLLDISRILRGKMVLNVRQVNLGTTIEAALETVQLAAEAKRIQIKTKLDTNPVLISGDANRLQQVIWNLLSNAVKFTDTGGEVEVCLEQIGSSAQIQVKDTGRGISLKFLPHMFDYFRQENSTTTRKFGGLGLGLAIVRHLVELHGGSVWAESPGEGQGAIFTVRLPMTVATAKETQKDNFDEVIQLDGLRILVVDDEADIRELVACILELSGAEVTLAASAEEAVIALSQSLPDLLLCDIGMPDVDGYALMDEIRKLPPTKGGKLPAIALTAYVGEYHQRKALAASFEMHIAKPVEPEHLVRAIAQIVRIKS
ncbi:MAG: PAS domain-containing protein [Coleofasciculaceae cyanobacterium]